MQPLPSSVKIAVEVSLARQLHRGALREAPLPRDLPGDARRQAEILERIRQGCPDGFDGLVAEIEARLERPPFVALVSGLRDDDEHLVLIALHRALGPLISYDPHPPLAELLHHIEPRTDMRVQGQTYSEALHTDGTNWEQVPSVVTLFCVRPHERDRGRSRVVEASTVIDRLMRRFGPRVVEVLEREAVPWVDIRGGSVMWQPVLGPNRIRWRHYSIEAGWRRTGATPSPQLAEALEAARSVATCEGHGVFDFRLESNDWLIASNTRTLHARSHIADPHASRRLMLRGWIHHEARPGV